MIGKTVEIECGGRTYSGKILSYHNYGHGGKTDRYIEFTHDENSAGPTGTYGYCKEQDDGVTAIRINN